MDPIFSEALKPISEILKTVVSVVDGYRERRINARISRWDRITNALDVIGTLVREHLAAIQTTVEPVVSRGDLEATNAMFQALANNPAFPTGYDEARGELKPFCVDPALTDDARVAISALLTKLFDFQSAAFLMSYDSYGVAAALKNAVELARQLKTQNGAGAEVLRQAVRDTFKKGPGSKPLGSLIDQQIEKAAALTTSDHVVQLVGFWCTSWQQHVQRTLYDRSGVNGLIGRLRAERSRQLD